MRNATVYGASPRLRLDIVLNNLVGWAHTTGAIQLLSDGTPWRPLVHVRDIARAHVRVARRARRARCGRGVQHRLRRAELPGSRPGGDRSQRLADVRGDVRGRRVARPAQLPRRLLEARPVFPDVRCTWTAAWASTSSPGPTRPPVSIGTPSKGIDTSAFAGCGTFSTRGAWWTASVVRSAEARDAWDRWRRPGSTELPFAATCPPAGQAHAASSSCAVWSVASRRRR